MLQPACPTGCTHMSSGEKDYYAVAWQGPLRHLSWVNKSLIYRICHSRVHKEKPDIRESHIYLSETQRLHIGTVQVRTEADSGA